MEDKRLKSETGLAKRVAELIEPAIEALGYRLVRVRLTGAGSRTLQIMAEHPDGSMGIGDCETVSRAISPILDVEDPISGSYTLEVSSPGIDRPLVRLEDFERWAGHEAKVELKNPLDGRRRFRGRVEGVVGEEVRFLLPSKAHGAEEEQVGVPFADLAEAKLVLTDALIADSRERAKLQQHVETD